MRNSPVHDYLLRSKLTRFLKEKAKLKATGQGHTQDPPGADDGAAGGAVPSREESQGEGPSEPGGEASGGPGQHKDKGKSGSSKKGRNKKKGSRKRRGKR